MNAVRFLLSRGPRRSDRGATMVEYGLLVLVIALIAVVGAAALGTRLDELFGTDIVNAF